MNNTQGRSSASKKAAKGAKKVISRAKKATRKLKTVKVKKVKALNLLGSAKKQLSALKKKSAKTLHNAKDKVQATEKEIMHYVKANPVKSVSAVALTALIAGFIAYQNKK